MRESPLRLNAGFGQLDHWNEDAIKAAGGKLGRTGRQASGRRPKLDGRSCSTPISQPQPPRATTHRRPPAPATGSDARGVRGVPQGGAGARPVRDRGVPQALRRLQGGDQLRGCGAAGQAAATVAEHGVPRDRRPTGHLQGRVLASAAGATAMSKSGSRRSTNCPTSWALVRQSFERQMGNGGVRGRFLPSVHAA